MATPGDYLINNSANDCNSLLSQLQEVKKTAHRLAQRMESLGTGALAGYQWPEGYTQSDFVALYNALDALPGCVVEDSVRDKIFKLVSHFQ